MLPSGTVSVTLTQSWLSNAVTASWIASAIVLLGLSASFLFVYVFYRRQFFLFQAAAWIANAASLVLQTFTAAYHFGWQQYISEYLVGLVPTGLMYISYCDLDPRPRLKQRLVSWTRAA